MTVDWGVIILPYPMPNAQCPMPNAPCPTPINQLKSWHYSNRLKIQTCQVC
ncbi:hypothetical protein [Nostoc linckia]|uniref:hypothetical protein n=1 Tax=Nostoc linckia TaxID=92942 RepID=UPI0015D4D96C|nr:hypothetical protein [Nostoc linckia]